MEDVLSHFLRDIGSAAIQNDRIQLSHLLCIDPAQNKYVVSLNEAGGQQQLANISDQQLNNLIDGQHFFNDEWLAFNELVISFIKLSRDLNPWSVLESYDLYTTYLNDLSIAFNNNNRGHFLTRLVHSTITVILPLTVKLDFQLYYKEDCLQPRLAYLASVLLKTFNNIRSQLTQGNDKKLIILFIGYKLCYIYFKLDNPLLCQNIFSNMNNASLVFSSFSMNEQVQYRYYLARFYLIKNQFADAFLHFSWCLNVVPAQCKQASIILKYLIPVAILMGKRPNFSYIQNHYYNHTQGQPAPQFLRTYHSLYQCIRLGDYSSFTSLISQPDIFNSLKRDNLLILIGQKSLIILIRNLIKRVWIMLDKPLRLNYEVVKIALRTTTAASGASGLNMFTLLTQPIQDITVENVLITLVDQNLLKGKLFLNQRAIALAKVNVFPPIDSIYFVRFGNGQEGKLGHNDKWMNS